MVAFLVPPLRGFKRIQDTVNPRKAKKAMNDAMDVALDHYFDALVADSRVKSGKYKGSWRRTGSRGHSLVVVRLRGSGIRYAAESRDESKRK